MSRFPRGQSSRGFRERIMVLITTHNETFGRYLKEWLDHKRYSCCVVSDGKEGLEHAQQDSPSVVVLDLYLKAPSGMEVLHRLLEQGIPGKSFSWEEFR